MRKTVLFANANRKEKTYAVNITLPYQQIENAVEVEPNNSYYLKDDQKSRITNKEQKSHTPKPRNIPFYPAQVLLVIFVIYTQNYPSRKRHKS